MHICALPENASFWDIYILRTLYQSDTNIFFNKCEKFTEILHEKTIISICHFNVMTSIYVESRMRWWFSNTIIQFSECTAIFQTISCLQRTEDVLF